MMAFEGPFLAAVIARLPEVKYNLAAYGVSYSLALFFEAPVIMLMAASTSLVKNYHSYVKLRNFHIFLIILVTVILLISLIPGIFYFVALDIIGLPQEVAELTHISLFFLIPWPGAIGHRRFLQGLLIANNKTKLVSYGTVIRLLGMTSTALLLFFFSEIPGAYLGAIALSAGVVLETAATHLMAGPLIKKLSLEKNQFTKIKFDLLPYKKIVSFYYPLAMATFIGLGTQPLVTVFVTNSRMALESLAVLPVINALVFIFRSIGLSYQEVAITFAGEKGQGLNNLLRFALKVSLITSSIFIFIVFTPFSDIWFVYISGLSWDLAQFSLLPAQLLVIIPALSMLISYQRALQVVVQKTAQITIATVIEAISIVLILVFTIYFLDWIGAVAAGLALSLGRLASNLYLVATNRRARRFLAS